MNGATRTVVTNPGITRIAGTAVTSAVNPAAGTQVTATASCPIGQVLLGGGGTATNTQSPELSILSQSFPSSTTQWTVVGVSTKITGGSTMTVQAFAICSGS